MGDRALVVFKETSELDGETKYSPVIYLHWDCLQEEKSNTQGMMFFANHPLCYKRSVRNHVISF